LTKHSIAIVRELALHSCALLSKAGVASCRMQQNTYMGLQSRVLSLITQESGEVDWYGKPFEFLPLGFMAYLGRDKAVTHLEAGKLKFDTAGYLSFLIWRSVYLTKQVLCQNLLYSLMQ
jgi:NADH dehydrogenase FAD-containing subunit